MLQFKRHLLKEVHNNLMDRLDPNFLKENVAHATRYIFEIDGVVLCDITAFTIAIIWEAKYTCIG